MGFTFSVRSTVLKILIFYKKVRLYRFTFFGEINCFESVHFHQKVRLGTVDTVFFCQKPLNYLCSYCDNEHYIYGISKLIFARFNVQVPLQNSFEPLLINFRCSLKIEIPNGRITDSNFNHIFFLIDRCSKMECKIRTTGTS